MSLTAVTTVYAGILCAETDFIIETAQERRCNRGHQQAYTAPFCPQCGNPVTVQPVKKPVSEAFRAQGEGMRGVGLRYDEFFADLVVAARGIYPASRRESSGVPCKNKSANYIVGVVLARVSGYAWESDGTPLTLDITDDTKAEVRRLAERFGIDPTRPVQMFLQLYQTS